MADLRSSSYMENRMQIQPYSGGFGRPTTFNQDFRSYSASYATYVETEPPVSIKELKKGKSANGSSSKGWGLNDPEFQRKRRVASYKAYSVEGKMKGSFRKSFRWFKDRDSATIKELKKGKSANGSSSKGWGLSDPEFSEEEESY